MGNTPNTITPNTNTPNSIFGSILADLPIRIGPIIWLAGLTDDLMEELDEFLDWARPDDLARVFDFDFREGEASAGEAVGLLDAEEAIDVVALLARLGRSGFLLRAETPAPNAHPGWGWCKQEWFYTEAFDATLLGRLTKWRSDLIAKQVGETIDV